MTNPGRSASTDRAALALWSQGATIAIVGSRTFPSLALVDRVVELLPETTLVVSGSALGVDKRAAASARRRGLYVQELPVDSAEWRTFGPVAGPIRNRLILELAHGVIAFWTGEVERSGTYDCFCAAIKMGLPVWVVSPSGRITERWRWA